MIKIIITILFIPSLLLANCDIPKKISKGEVSSCDGYVISSETEQKIRIDLSYKDALIKNLEETNKRQNEIIKIDQEQLKIYNDQLKDQRQFTAFEKALYFSLGAVLTGVVAYGTVKAIR